MEMPVGSSRCCCCWFCFSCWVFLAAAVVVVFLITNIFNGLVFVALFCGSSPWAKTGCNFPNVAKNNKHECALCVCVCECVWIHHALSQSFIRRGSCLMPNKIFWNFNYFRLSVSECACCVCVCVCVVVSATLAAWQRAPLLLPLTAAHCAAQCDSWQQGRRHVLLGFLHCTFKGCKVDENPEKNRHYELGWPNECERLWMRNVFEY